MAVIGKAFKVKRETVKGYGYAKPNPGVTAIAAINGPGSYRRGRSARQAMSGKSPSERRAHAKNLTRRERAAFGKAVSRAKREHSRNKTDSSARFGAARRRLRSAIARSSTTRRKDSMRYSSNRSAAQRRAALQNLRKARAARRAKGYKANRRRGRRKMRRNAAAAPRRRRRRMRRNARQTAAQRRASMSNLRKARAARRAKGYKANRKRRTRRKMRRNAAPKRRRTRRRRKAYATNRRRRRSYRRNAAPKRRRTRRRRKAYATNRRRRRAGRRRSYASNRRHRSRRGRRYTKNRMYRRNPFLDNLKIALKGGAAVAAGIVGVKVVERVLSDFVFDKLFGAPATPATPPAAPAVSGLEALQPYKPIIGGFLAMVGGVALTNMVVKDVNTKMLVASGMAGAFIHTLVTTLLKQFAPEAAGYLGAYEDSTAAKLSAMYGLGAGASIMPRYAPIGMGEYFTEPMAGLGEYFTEGVAGLGNYTGNPDIYQAAAGYGAMPNANSNHVSPNGDLDRELTIAEAAAGVGAVQPFEAAAGFGQVPLLEAAAGIGEYFTEGVAGLGAITRVPTADTWIPGTSMPQLWAGVRGVTHPQASSAMVPAGILQTDGGSGVFG